GDRAPDRPRGVPRRRAPARDSDGGGLRLPRDPRDRDLLPDDHARARHGCLGARLPLGLDDQGRQRHRGRAATGARAAVEPRGAAAIVFLKNFVSVYTKRWLLILGAVYIGVILFAPRGVLGAFSREPHSAR